MGAVVLAAFAFYDRLGNSQSTSAQATAAPGPGALSIPQGQKFILRLETALHTNHTHKGDRVEFKTASDLFVENQLVIPSGSLVKATVTKCKRAGRLGGRAEIQLRLDEVRLSDGTMSPLRATITRAGLDLLAANKGGQPSIKGESGAGGSAGQVLSGGIQGAVIGVISAGGKGALYGGAAGAAIAVAGMVFRRGPDLDLPQDTLFEARFDQPLAVPMVVAQRAQQIAQNPPAEPQDQVRQAEEPIRSRPVLRRPRETEQAQPAPSTDPQAPVGAPTIPTPEPPPSTTPPPEPPPTFPPAEAHPPLTPPVRSTPSPTEAKPADPAAYKLSVNVRMVLVDAVVRDRSGQMIENLKKDDFRVYEDGVEQQIQTFSRDELPLAVAIVIDRSGSVAPYIDELRRIAYRALMQLKPQDRVALFSFASTVERLEDLTADRQRIADRIAHIRAGGGTDIVDALYDATAYLAKSAPDCRRAIILVSDNQATVRPRASEGETIRLAMETETVVYSLKTAGQGAALAMRLPNLVLSTNPVGKVTQDTGGEIIDVKNVGMLDAALGAVVSRLRLRYAIGYAPPAQGRGAFHTIEVRLADRMGSPGKDYTVHARRGYYSTTDLAGSHRNSG